MVLWFARLGSALSPARLTKPFGFFDQCLGRKIFHGGAQRAGCGFDGIHCGFVGCPLYLNCRRVSHLVFLTQIPGLIRFGLCE